MEAKQKLWCSGFPTFEELETRGLVRVSNEFQGRLLCRKVELNRHTSEKGWFVYWPGLRGNRVSYRAYPISNQQYGKGSGMWFYRTKDGRPVCFFADGPVLEYGQACDAVGFEDSAK